MPTPVQGVGRRDQTTYTTGEVRVVDKEPGGGGGDSSVKCPDVCVGPIMKDALCQKTYPY